MNPEVPMLLILLVGALLAVGLAVQYLWLHYRTRHANHIDGTIMLMFGSIPFLGYVFLILDKVDRARPRASAPPATPKPSNVVHTVTRYREKVSADDQHPK